VYSRDILQYIRSPMYGSKQNNTHNFNYPTTSILICTNILSYIDDFELEII